jgi:hypothetical protein
MRPVPVATLEARPGDNILIISEGQYASDPNSRHALVQLMQKGLRMNTQWKVYSADPSITFVDGEFVIPAGVQPPLLLDEFDASTQQQ